MNKKAVTLIELIIGITISLLLMTSIGVFVSSGLQNLFVQQNTLSQGADLQNFISHIGNRIENMKKSSGSILLQTNSGILFKRNIEYDKGGFTYIGSTNQTNFFCNDSELGNIKTKHAFIRDFIPFIENGENTKDLDNIFTSTITHGGNTYTSYQKEHVVRNDSGNIIVGKGVFGHKGVEGGAGTDWYLNSPTGLASDGKHLYISDTLNNRILYMSGSNIYILLDETDGLDEPTGLFHDGDFLYIANSAKGEILKFGGKKYIAGDSKNLNINFSVENNIEITEVDISFSHPTSIVDFNLPTSTGQLEFTNISQKTDFLTGSTNYLQYHFSDFSYLESTITNTGCIDPQYLVGEGGIVRYKKTQNCSGGPSGTGNLVTYKDNTPITLTTGTPYTIKVPMSFKNNPLPGTYKAKLSFYNGLVKVHEIEEIFFIQGDGDVTSKGDNQFEVYRNGLDYPNAIWGTGPTDFSTFTGSNYSGNIPLNRKYDTIIKTPISNLKMRKIPNLLNMKLEYYQNYDCYNPDSNSGKIRTYLYKKFIDE